MVAGLLGIGSVVLRANLWPSPNEPMMRATLITRTGQNSFVTAQPWDTNAPRLLGFAEPSAFHF